MNKKAFTKAVALVLIFLKTLINDAECSGRLMDPIARSSCWRQFPDECPVEHNDNMLNCGGIQQQWGKNEGKCSVCGEDWSLRDKKFELGGDSSSPQGFIVKTYRQGQEIEAKIELSSNRAGWFEFRLCKLRSDDEDATQECLDENLLEDRQGNTRIRVKKAQKGGQIRFRLQLPKELTCDHCVFQWKYHTATNWGRDEETGVSCVGCGPQEEFYGCSDIKISPSSAFKKKNVSKKVSPKPKNKLAFSSISKITQAKSAAGLKKTSSSMKTKAHQSKSSKNNSKTFKSKLINALQENDCDNETEQSENNSNSSSVSLKCPKGDGFYRNKSDKSKYYVCTNTGTQFERVQELKCPAGLKFDTDLKTCNWPSDVDN